MFHFTEKDQNEENGVAQSTKSINLQSFFRRRESNSTCCGIYFHVSGSTTYVSQLIAYLQVNAKAAKRRASELTRTKQLHQGTSGDIGEVMKRVFGDEVLSLFNWNGRCGKKSLSEFKIVSVALFEIFKLHGRIDFEKEVRKSVEQSHNRQKQKRYLLNKKNL
ncbi:uncharacterized protein LOC126766562 isoform X2 [Bactrocera neohumeralis]|uniref:uncharacterized protein LOC126766562 isoform X2 n=1 Tax=Bactrocera neohumeralis TaxID=98809 RepID=UPI0021652564|nr:uncharacterized protein LOC126766562 isoform X2 [Bactrocera neohumeralis]